MSRKKALEENTYVVKCDGCGKVYKIDRGSIVWVGLDGKLIERYQDLKVNQYKELLVANLEDAYETFCLKPYDDMGRYCPECRATLTHDEVVYQQMPENLKTNLAAVMLMDKEQRINIICEEEALLRMRYQFNQTYNFFGDIRHLDILSSKRKYAVSGMDDIRWPGLLWIEYINSDFVDKDNADRKSISVFADHATRKLLHKCLFWKKTVARLFTRLKERTNSKTGRKALCYRISTARLLYEEQQLEFELLEWKVDKPVFGLENIKDYKITKAFDYVEMSLAPLGRNVTNLDYCRKLAQNHKDEIIQLALDRLEKETSWLKYGISINFLEVTNLLIAMDCTFHIKFNLKTKPSSQGPTV